MVGRAGPELKSGPARYFEFFAYLCLNHTTMIRKIAFSLLFLAAVAVNASAQAKSPSNYAPGREALANDTFRELVEMCPLLDKMNLAGDLAIGDRLIENLPHLRTALLENLIFDYCNISDSLKTVENFRVGNIFQRSSFTNKSTLQWNELGQLYATRRAGLENLGKNPSPLHLVGNPLSGRPTRLRLPQLGQKQGDLAPRRPAPPVPDTGKQKGR